MFSVIIPTARPKPVLMRCLQSLAAQRFDLTQLEVCVVSNGGAKITLDAQAWPFAFKHVHIDAPSAAAARNRGLACTSGAWVLFLNDDVELDANCLSAHLAAHHVLERPALVLGSAAWAKPADETLLDRLVADTSLIMFYDQMRPHGWYGFRHAWTLNLSVAREYTQREHFDERLSPVNFEDIEWAFRLERRCGMQVWYAPEAASIHHHRYTLDDCLARERQVGGMAVKLWQCNPACFRAVFGADLDEGYRAFCRHAVRTDAQRAADLAPTLHQYARTPADALHNAPGGADAFMKLVYHALQPVRRVHFRQGVLEALAENAAGPARPQQSSPPAPASTAPSDRPAFRRKKRSPLTP